MASGASSTLRSADSPSTAVIFKHPDAPATFDSRQLTPDEVAELNTRTYAYAHEYVFGQSAAALEAARSSVGG